MRRALCSYLLLTSALAAGCAGNRENVADTATAAATPAAPSATALAAEPAEAAAPGAPAAVVDGNQLAARSSGTLLCRDMLVRGSNVNRRMCGTAEQWKAHERREAEAAGRMVRQMQRGRWN